MCIQDPRLDGISSVFIERQTVQTWKHFTPSSTILVSLPGLMAIEQRNIATTSSRFDETLSWYLCLRGLGQHLSRILTTCMWYVCMLAALVLPTSSTRPVANHSMAIRQGDVSSVTAGAVLNPSASLLLATTRPSMKLRTRCLIQCVHLPAGRR